MCVFVHSDVLAATYMCDPLVYWDEMDTFCRYGTQNGWCSNQSFRDTTAYGSSELMLKHLGFENCKTFSSLYFIEDDLYGGGTTAYEVPFCSRCNDDYDLDGGSFLITTNELGYSRSSRQCTEFYISACICDIQCNNDPGDSWAYVEDGIVERYYEDYPADYPSGDCACEYRSEVSCAYGYYGEPYVGSGCKPCPYGGYSDPGDNYTISSCYGGFCPAGEYGDPYSNDGCQTCPDGGTSEAGDNSDISGCYMPKNSRHSDDTGDYEFTTKCMYND